jgi:hypothetical protein
MGVSSIQLFILLGLLAFPAQAQKQPTEPKPGATAGGVFVGRSGKPMAKARLVLGEILGDQDVTVAKIKLLTSLPPAICDDQGRFQLKGFSPGEYTIVYLPGGAGSMPAEINIKPFLAVTRSLTPELNGYELGKSDPYPERIWGREFTLLKGHTFYSEGANMKVWNATARRGPQGPHLEIRRGLIWQPRLDNNVQIKFEAWSY